MMGRAATIAATIIGSLVLEPRQARACSPPRDPSFDLPPCRFVQLWTPAQSFPRQLQGSIRLGTFDQRGNVLSPDVTFDPNVQILVHRATAGGYAAVPFTLVSQTGLVPNALRIQLADPVPGQYVVSSPNVTCSAAPSPVGTGLEVGTFELEPDTALPSSLGDLHSLGAHTVEQTLEVDDGNCGTTEVTTRVTHSELELQLDASALPWADVIDTAWYVDGALYRGFSRPAVSADGVVHVDLTRVCSSSAPALVAIEAGLGAGRHTIKLAGRIEELAVVESSETTFTLDCEDDDGWAPSVGCAARGDGRGSALVLVALALVARRTRRRTTHRA